MICDAKPVQDLSKDELFKLSKEWNKKLKDSGFQDIERYQLTDTNRKVIQLQWAHGRVRIEKYKEYYNEKVRGRKESQSLYSEVSEGSKGFQIKQGEYSEFFRVIEINAFNNPKVKERYREPMQVMCMRGLSTSWISKEFPDITYLRIYKYILRNRAKFIKFALEFNSQEEEYRVAS